MKQSVLLLFILLTCNSIMLPAQDTDIVKTVDTINAKLKRWAEGGAPVYITAKMNGDISIINKSNQSTQFNLFELSIGDDTNNRNNGIEIIRCDKRTHASINWINFYTPEKQVAFIRLDCNTPLSGLESIYNEFMHLKSLCKKSKEASVK